MGQNILFYNIIKGMVSQGKDLYWSLNLTNKICQSSLIV